MKRTKVVREYMPRIYRADVPSQRIKHAEREELERLTREYLACGGEIEKLGVTDSEGWIDRREYFRRKADRILGAKLKDSVRK